MIRVKEFPNQVFKDKSELFTALRENKNDIIAAKKMVTKEADAVVFYSDVMGLGNSTNKAEALTLENATEIKAEVVINTTNVMDSHSDVHMKGIWNKSVKEQKNLYLLQEHQMTFDKIITDNVKASVEVMSWKDLGYSYDGTTEALKFTTVIDNKRNPFMFNQYSKGYVREHSVGMRYIKIDLALNSESKYDTEEKAVWDKYIENVANKEAAEAQGFFYAVTEAKIIEGSAVVKGSNSITPTLSVEAVKNTSTTEPSNDTQKFNVMDALKNIQIIKN
jgi:hypothetical protein